MCQRCKLETLIWYKIDNIIRVAALPGKPGKVKEFESWPKN